MHIHRGVSCTYYAKMTKISDLEFSHTSLTSAKQYCQIRKRGGVHQKYYFATDGIYLPQQYLFLLRNFKKILRRINDEYIQLLVRSVFCSFVKYLIILRCVSGFIYLCVTKLPVNHYTVISRCFTMQLFLVENVPSTGRRYRYK